MRHVVFVDSREGAMKESGDVILSCAKIYAEMAKPSLARFRRLQTKLQSLSR